MSDDDNDGNVNRLKKGDSDISPTELSYVFLARDHLDLVLSLGRLPLFDGNAFVKMMTVVAAFHFQGGEQKTEVAVQPWKWSLHHLFKRGWFGSEMELLLI